MRKSSSAFSIIELVVVMTILGILFVIAAPTLRGSQDRSEFNDEARLLFERISDARANALAGKKCGDGPSRWWAIDISATDHNYVFRCDADGSVDEETITLNQAVTLVDSLTFPPETLDVGKIRLLFFSETGQAKIQDITNDPAVIKPALKITLLHTPTNDLFKTICINAVSAYPLFGDGESCP